VVNLELAFEPGRPLRSQLEHALRVAIRNGRLQPGAVLPPSRVLAQELGVSRGVVVESYSQLVAEGYLSARQGSATRVAQLPAQWAPTAPRRVEPSKRFRYDLRPGQADFHAFPRSRWQSALVNVLRELPDTRLGYCNHRGTAELRNAVAEHLARMRGVVADPERVVICCAASQALSVIWAALRGQGVRRVGIEDPGWRWQRLTVERAELEAVPIRVDANGLVVDELIAAQVDAVVLTPAHQYPTGVVMSPKRRQELVAWARERGALIVEDDYDVEYRYDQQPIAALQGLAPDQVAFVGTTSKTLAPALRMAWMVLPSRLSEAVEHELLVSGVTPPTLEQIALASFMTDGSLERHLRRMRRRYASKRQLLVEMLAQALPEVRISGASAGLHLLATLPEEIDEHETALRARRAGVGVHELHRHCTTVAPRPPALVLGYALPSESELVTAVGLLAGAVHGRRASRLARHSAV
jgi:GntR family transcriptional regulator/MocR family aminotransferase